MSDIIRKDQFSVTVVLNGVSYGVWDTFSGGDTDSSEKKYSPGGMAPERSLGGKRTTGNVTLRRAYDSARDLPTITNLKSLAGRADAIVTKEALDRNGIPYGYPEVITGKLKKVTSPEHDSNSTDETVVEIEISTNTPA